MGHPLSSDLAQASATFELRMARMWDMVGRAEPANGLCNMLNGSDPLDANEIDGGYPDLSKYIRLALPLTLSIAPAHVLSQSSVLDPRSHLVSASLYSMTVIRTTRLREFAFDLITGAPASYMTNQRPARPLGLTTLGTNSSYTLWTRSWHGRVRFAPCNWEGT